MDLLALAALATAGALLVWSGIEHLRRPSAFLAALVAHRLVPYRLVRSAATIFIAAECLVGAAALLGVVAAAHAPAGWLVVTGVAASCLYATITVYVVRLRRSSPGLPCGCFGDLEPASRATIVRAAVLTVASGGGAAGSAPTTAMVGVVALGLAVPLAVAVRHLPAMAAPRLVAAR